VPAREIPGGQLEIKVRAGRVELGHSAGDQLRVRWTVPKTRGFRRGEPRWRFGRDGLRIRCRRARLRIDLPTGMTVRVRLARGQITSWGADGDLDLAVSRGSVACRELRSQVAIVRAPEVNLHFAAVPRLVDVDCEHAILALPGGPYALAVPPGAEVTVTPSSGDPAGVPRIRVQGKRVQGKDVRVLASSEPLRLTGESADG
jgi:hypothetical protein